MDDRILSPIERIPYEVTWKIFDFVPDALFNLRLVWNSFSEQLGERSGVIESLQASQTLHNCANAYAFQRRPGPIVETLEINATSANSARNSSCCVSHKSELIFLSEQWHYLNSHFAEALEDFRTSCEPSHAASARF